MVGLHVLYPADVFIFSGQLAQPGAPGNIFACPRVDPDIVDSIFSSKIYDVHPCQDIATVILLPASNILFSGAYVNRSRKVQATMAALFAGEIHQVFTPSSSMVLSESSRQTYPISIPASHRSCLRLYIRGQNQ